MREFKRRKSERPLSRLIRGADGRLRAAGSSDDIGDIWAEQRRIKLQEAIEEDKRRAAKKAARKTRWHRLLRKSKRTARSGGSEGGSSDKALEIKINLPSKLPLPKLAGLGVSQRYKKRYLIAVIIVGALALGYGSFQLVARGADRTAKKTTTSETLGVDSVRPDYDTILPLGKTIQELGGWGRVSPPGKAPVFAYVDSIDGVHIRVSQQPLPASFKKDLPGQLAGLAEQFNAKEKLTAGDTTIYVGTSIKGPQSAVLSKKSLLILISADSKLSNKQWTDYIWILQ
jgi:hypothetical protein